MKIFLRVGLLFVLFVGVSGWTKATTLEFDEDVDCDELALYAFTDAQGFGFSDDAILELAVATWFKCIAAPNGSSIIFGDLGPI